MYSPGEERDESAFNLPAINFNRIPSCCTAWTPRLFSASPSPLSPISTTICFARAFSKRMSDSFLLPCAIFPPSPFYPLWPLLHTLCLSHAVCAPQPPPFLSLLQCLRMQSLPECAMSFLLGSAASFTVDWFLFRSRGNGSPPPPLFLSSPLPPPPPFLPQGRQTAWEMGPTCAAWWMAAPLLVHVPWQPGGGRGRAGYAPPSPPLPGTLLLGVWGGGGEENHPRPLSPPPRHGGQGAHGCLGGGRTEPSCFGRGRFRPLGEICCAVQPPPPRRPPSPRCTQAPAQPRSGICPADLARSSGMRDHKCNRLL